MVPLLGVAGHTIALAILTGSCDCPTEPSGFAGGSGFSVDPYLVCNAAQLQLVGAHLDASFRLTADIDLTGIAFVPIADGPFTGEMPTFNGTFDGAGYTVNGFAAGDLTMSDDVIGLFGRIGTTGMVRDLHLTNVDVEANICGGGLAAENRGLIERCSVDSGTVNGGFVGGLVGDNRGFIEDSCAHATVLGSSIGGLVGLQFQNSPTVPTIRRCYATGAVSGNTTGGLIGNVIGGGSVVEDSYWDTQTSGQATSAGGVGRTTAQMKQPGTFAGWAFGTVWDIEPAIDYPRLLLAPPGCCAADLTGSSGTPDGNVDALDFLTLIGQWGSPCVGACEADITGPTPLLPDGNVDSLDFLLLVSQWGACFP